LNVNPIIINKLEELHKIIDQSVTEKRQPTQTFLEVNKQSTRKYIFQMTKRYVLPETLQLNSNNAIKNFNYGNEVRYNSKPDHRSQEITQILLNSTDFSHSTHTNIAKSRSVI
jgi:hypothetical protein